MEIQGAAETLDLGHRAGFGAGACPSCFAEQVRFNRNCDITYISRDRCGTQRHAVGRAFDLVFYRGDRILTTTTLKLEVKD